MHLTRESITAILTGTAHGNDADHLVTCAECDQRANEVALELGLGDSLAWALASLPDLPPSEEPALVGDARARLSAAASAADLVRDPVFESEEGLLALLRAAHDLLDIDPARLDAIARVVIDANSACALPSDPVATVALRERANALRRLGDLRGSLAAIAEGRVVAARLAVSDHELAVFDYLEALVLVDQSLPGSARTLVTSALATFRRFGDTRRSLYARCLLGALDHQLGELETARSEFRALVTPLADIGDHAASVGALHNAGDCSLLLGELVTAREELDTAERGYRELGLTTEVLRVRWLLARLTVEEARFDDAERAFVAIAEAFAAMGLRLDAALVRLDLVGLFERSGRRDEAVALTRELAAVFASSDARGRLADALTILREAVERGSTLDSPLQEARDAVSELRTDSDFTSGGRR